MADVFKIKLNKLEYVEFLGKGIPDPKGRVFKFAAEDGTQFDEESSIVVQCANCRLIHLYKTWDENGNSCMNCSGRETNSELDFSPFSGEPNIVEFGSEPFGFIEGYPVVVYWRIDRANNVSLDNEQVQPYGRKEIIADRQNIELTLKATNPRSFFTSSRKVQQLIIEPALPEVLIFGTEDAVLQPGQTPKINIRLRNAVRYSLEADYDDGGIETIHEAECKLNEFFQADFELSTQLNGSAKLVLHAYNAYKEIFSRPLYIEVPTPRFVEELKPDYIIAVAGAPVQLTWRVENATRVVLSDSENEIELEGETYVYIPKEGHRTITLQLTAWGAFGQRIKGREVKLQIARITNFRAYSNYDVLSPKFFLAWEGDYMSVVTLNPPPLFNKQFSEAESRVEIPVISEPVTYTLTAWPDTTQTRPPIVKTLTLKPVHIYKFQPEGGEAILGTTCTVQWEVESARRVDIEGIVSNVKGTSHSFKVAEEHRLLTLTAWGDAGMAQHFVPMQIFVPPKVTDIRLPLLSLCVRFDFTQSAKLALPDILRGQTSELESLVKYRQSYLDNKLRHVIFPSKLLFKLYRSGHFPMDSWQTVTQCSRELKWKIRATMFDIRQQLRERIKNETKVK